MSLVKFVCDQKPSSVVLSHEMKFFLQVAMNDLTESILSASCCNVGSQLPRSETGSANTEISLSHPSQTN